MEEKRRIIRDAAVHRVSSKPIVERGSMVEKSKIRKRIEEAQILLRKAEAYRHPAY